MVGGRLGVDEVPGNVVVVGPVVVVVAGAAVLVVGTVDVVVEADSPTLRDSTSADKPATT